MVRNAVAAVSAKGFCPGVIRTLAILAVCATPFSHLHAADIRLLDDNPARSAGYQLLDLGTVSEEAISHVRGLQDGFTSKDAVKDGSLPYFENGISGDGAHTYETLHIVPAWGGLKTGKVISIEGQIEKGDLDRLKELVERTGFSDCLKPGYCPYNNVISLNSPGGNLREALEIGKYIAGQNFITLLPENATCESACSLIFLAGYTRYEGFFFPRRFAHETARLGIHQPFLQLPEGNYSADQVEHVVRLMNQGVNEVTDYFLSTGIGIGFMRNMYGTKPGSMYYLSLAEMAGEGIFVVGRPQDLSNLGRSQMLSYCSGVYQGRFNALSPELLANLQSNERTFLTYVTGQNFVCLGVKSQDGNSWRSYVCDGSSKCLLGEFGQVALFELEAKGKLSAFRARDAETLMNIATGIDNTEIGLALKEDNHRVALLYFVELFAENMPTFQTSFKRIPASLAFAKVPQDFCGQVDEYDAGLVRLVQEALNDKGIDVGTPDGSLGPNTRKAIGRASRQLLNRDDSVIDPPLLKALGVPEDEVRGHVLCGG
ncbi:hypothetical protein V1T76_23720 [Roseibium sp. FZY0029]|uniref:COG3904 family protein n=1 Tax=Roseibium sp. FZY0029 TaxID=3116647 RepID=UPI002EC5B8EB|nr:hypothetical protein [Roseibium sp. FZY0029]